MSHIEKHKSGRAAWLRAAVLGANDGIVSTASLVLGVAAAHGSNHGIVVAGLAGLVGGALSMAAGEYVSVSSQRDVEDADLARERLELIEQPEHELEELVGLVADKGVPMRLAREVAIALTEKDALEAHARLELGIDLDNLAQPVQAAVVSALSFSVGAAVPLAVIALSPQDLRIGLTIAAASALLAALGALAAKLGGAPARPAVLRVLAGGLAAMGLTAVIGWWLGGLL